MNYELAWQLHSLDVKTLLSDIFIVLIWWLGTESNRRHKDFQSSALPTELPSPTNVLLYNINYNLCKLFVYTGIVQIIC